LGQEIYTALKFTWRNPWNRVLWGLRKNCAMMPTLLKFHRRPGWTLVELLVVIAIIAVIIGLLIPAVQKGREVANRVWCSNNLKNLGLALHSYHGVYGKFPAGALGPRPGFPQFDGLKRHGLGTFLLPYLEQELLFKQYRLDVSWCDPPNQPVVINQLPMWQCPSAEANRIQDGALITVTPPAVDLFSGNAACGDYAGMLGVHPELVARAVINPPGGPRDVAGYYEGVRVINGTRRFADILDGTSRTILMAECAGRPQLWQGRKKVPDKWLTGGPWASRSLLWCRGATQDGTDFYGQCAINCTNDREIYSFHPGGANAVFADASVRFLSDDMPIHILAALVTRDGGQIVSATDY
jgi:prepilin-type N-terminal cleavage/methylation domain-containing protein/prepilin-type processing-associated H-X9-DG protein